MGVLRPGPDDVRVLRFDELEPQPWRNGAGTTREVARGASVPSGLPGWRVSIADLVTDGPFSRFAGQERIAVALDDDAVELTVEGVATVLTAYDPFTFGGDATTSVHLLSGITRLLNVMTAAARPSTELRVVQGGTVETRVDDAAIHVVVVLAGSGTLVAPTLATVLAPLDSLVVGPSTPTRLELAHAVAAVLRVP